MPTLEELARLRQQARQRRQPGAATGQNAAGVAQLGNAQRPGQPVNPVAGNDPTANPRPGNYGAVPPPATGGRQTKPGAPEGPPDFTPGAGPGRPATPDSLDELTRMRMAHEKERKAAEERLAAEKGRALQQADARAGFAGLGLSGGTAALSSDIGRVQDREATLTLGELGRDQRTEEWQAIQRQIALDRIEKELDTDLNNDGKVAGRKTGDGIGDGDTENDPKTPEQEQKQTEDRETAAARDQAGGTGDANDPYGGIGGYGDNSQEVLDALKAGGVTFSYVRTEGGMLNGEQYVYALGSDGNYYKFKVPGTGIGAAQPLDQVKAWFSEYE